jgi:membrane protein DedA with SNARE-associated domain
MAIFTAAFTPIPHKIFTIAAGACGISLWVLFLASLLGRGARFYAVAAVMYFFGPTVTQWIDKYFNRMTLVFALLLILGFIALPYIKHFF